MGHVPRKVATVMAIPAIPTIVVLRCCCPCAPRRRLRAPTLVVAACGWRREPWRFPLPGEGASTKHAHSKQPVSAFVAAAFQVIAKQHGINGPLAKDNRMMYREAGFDAAIKACMDEKVDNHLKVQIKQEYFAQVQSNHQHVQIGLPNKEKIELVKEKIRNLWKNRTVKETNRL